MATLNSCIYAVGGFDGTNGLDSVEKYDPCELPVSVACHVTNVQCYVSFQVNVFINYILCSD